MKERKPVKNRFKDKVAIVTGGSSGIGRAIMEELCKEGASVAFSGISDVGLDTARELNDAGFDVLFCRGDMADEGFCENLVDSTLDKWGRVNYLVNNVFSFVAKGLDATTKDWERVFMVGPVGYARMVQNVVKPMEEEGGGAIVNMSSISAFQAQVNRWTYNAAKGAVHTLTRNMALDLVKYNIRVNSISPGGFFANQPERFLENYTKKVPAERMANDDDIKGVIVFLASQASSYITGENILMDGGMHC